MKWCQAVNGGTLDVGMMIMFFLSPPAQTRAEGRG